jgi:hypothetical protein
MSHEGPGLLRCLCTALGGALRRGRLGQSTRVPRKQLTGIPESEFEPVHGWTKRQRDVYLARNPGYRATYEAELHRACYAAAPEGDGASLADCSGKPAPRMPGRKDGE